MLAPPGAHSNIHGNDLADEKEVNEWTRFGFRIAVGAALHPFEYAKVLAQLGYEPIAPRPGKSLLGKDILVLPNMFQYVGYIRRMDGFYGMYRGLSPKIFGNLLAFVCSEKVITAFKLPTAEECKLKDDVDLSDEELYLQFKLNLKRDLVISMTSIIVCQPFHVISLRMMAQFIGGEKIYQSIVGSIIEIYKYEGISGFFSGLLPKLIGDVASLILTSTTVFMLNKYLIKDKVGRHYNSGLTQFAIASMLYPFQVVASCMCVTGSRLMAASPPMMPMYRNSIDCWNHLSSLGELKRGNAFFLRYVPGPRKNNYISQTNYSIMPPLSKKQ
ncbi:mitochondrial carrier homolog 2-like [Teleopsis dalmanni]|uniref:mitochondrial carrier homolog 2-like n=1 Tax=Teleopsis dalmanni TaxID=139649 RepID=UPI0018CF7F6C|nr:mitochondrial carrier homolog 2-like [Teleopsis dalmanni]XP_037939027.1 mitochondrial carrier homolog 2-like [Teleopsis dalmanni]XP_037940682.1 mitochondrial carrier homolog 2-like [Teleopsis dalmanni]